MMRFIRSVWHILTFEHWIFVLLALGVVFAFGARLQALDSSLHKAWTEAERSAERWRPPPTYRRAPLGCMTIMDEWIYCPQPRDSISAWRRLK